MFKATKTTSISTQKALLTLERHGFVFRRLKDGERICISTGNSHSVVADTRKILSMPGIAREIADARKAKNPLLHALAFSANHFTARRQPGKGYNDMARAEVPLSELVASRAGECFEKALLSQILASALGHTLMTANGMVAFSDGQRNRVSCHTFNILEHNGKTLYLVDVALPSSAGLPFLCGMPPEIAMAKKAFSGKLAIGTGFPFQFCMELVADGETRRYQLSFPRLSLPAKEWGA